MEIQQAETTIAALYGFVLIIGVLIWLLTKIVHVGETWTECKDTAEWIEIDPLTQEKTKRSRITTIRERR